MALDSQVISRQGGSVERRERPEPAAFAAFFGFVSGFVSTGVATGANVCVAAAGAAEVLVAVFKTADSLAGFFAFVSGTFTGILSGAFAAFSETTGFDFNLGEALREATFAAFLATGADDFVILACFVLPGADFAGLRAGRDFEARDRDATFFFNFVMIARRGATFVTPRQVENRFIR